MYGCPSLLLDKSVFELFETISVHLLVVPIFRDVVSLIIFIFHFIIIVNSETSQMQ